MNCLDFRRTILADPRDAGSEARLHAAGCAACAQFEAEAVALDAQLIDGLSVPVPGGLAQRIVERSLAPARAGRRRFLARAASLVVATSAGAGLYLAGRSDPLALAGIDFVVDEEANAILRAKPADPAVLQSVSRDLQVEIPRDIGEVRYIGTCPFQGTIAHHVVIMTPEGKATLLLLPEMPIESRARASSRGLRAVVVPAGPGSLAIIAEAVELRRIEEGVVRRRSVAT